MVSPESAGWISAATITPLTRSTACSALCARCVVPSFIFVIRASGSLELDSHGKMTVEARVPTHAGARNPAVTDKGVVYLAHSSFGGLTDLVVVTPEK